MQNNYKKRSKGREVDRTVTPGFFCAQYINYRDDEKRRSERYAYPSRIEYVLNGGSAPLVHKAVTVNISDSGLSVYAFAPLVAHQEIVITSRLPLEHRRATVCWVRHEYDLMYKLGLKFSNRKISCEEMKGRA
jgi:hypothetical protein